ncbi:MAG: hypothetical protein AAF488_09720 [Planctomycetota bacterium]
MGALFLALALFGFSAPAIAQNAVSFGTQDGLVGSVEPLCTPAPYHSWVPVRLTIENRGEATRSIEVRLELTENSAADRVVTWVSDIGPGASKTQILPAYVGSSDFMILEVSLWESGVEIFRSREDRMQLQRRDHQINSNFSLRQNNGGFPYSKVVTLFVVAEDSARLARTVQRQFEEAWEQAEGDRAAARFVTGTRFAKEIVGTVVASQELPVAPEAYEAIDRVVLIGVRAADVSQAQRVALQRAVHAGRVAWIVPGRDGAGSDWVLPSPVQRRTLVETGGDAEWTALEVADDPGVVVTTRAFGMEGSSESLPEVLDYPTGLGHWRRVAVLPPTDDVPFAVDVTYERATSLASPADDGELYRDDVPELAWIDAIDRLYREEVPVTLVFAIIVTYLLAIGPLLFWTLKRKGRLIWLLWVQPAVVVVFLVGTYTVGYLHFGAFTRTYQTLVVQLPAAGTGWGFGHALTTRYNPREGFASLEAFDGSLPMFRPLGGRNPELSWRFDPNGARLEQVALPEWSYSHFMTSGPLELGGGLELRSEFLKDGSALGGVAGQRFTLKNVLPFSVHRPAFRVQDRIVQIDQTLFPGQTVEIDTPSLGLQSRGAGAGGFSATPVVRQLLNGLPQRTGLVVVEFDPKELPGGQVPFGIDTEYAEQRGYLILVGKP